MIDLEKIRIYEGMPLYYVDDYNHLCKAKLLGFRFDEETKKVSYVVRKYKYDVELVKENCILGFGGELFTDAEDAVRNKLIPLEDQYKLLTSKEYEDNIGKPDKLQLLMLSRTIEYLRSQSPYYKACYKLYKLSQNVDIGIDVYHKMMEHKNDKKVQKETSNS